MGKPNGYGTFYSLIWYFVGSPIFGEGFGNGLEWELCGQKEKKGLV